MNPTMRRIVCTMLFALLFTPVSGAVCSSSQHAALREAHQKAATLAEHLYEEVDHVNAINNAAVRPMIEDVARALHQVREAEQTCTHAGAPKGKVAAWNYQQMLDHHQAAMDDLDQLQKEIAGTSPTLNHVIGYAIDIRRQMDMAEESHQDSRA